MRQLIVCAAALCCLTGPSWSQGADRDTAETAPKNVERKGSDVEFIDSTDAYWVTKSFNDTLYCNGGGSVNSCRLERDQFRNDDVLSKIYKPAKVEVKVNGKVQQPTMPVLKMGGKEVKVP